MSLNQTSLLAEMDQLIAGLASEDQEAVLNARKALALLARDASPFLLLWIFRAIVQSYE